MALDLLIVGDSGLAKETAQLARQIDPSAARWQLISYVGEKKRDLGKAMAYGKVGYADDQLANMDHHVDVALGVGYPGARARLAQRFVMNPYLSFPNLLHPKVEIDDRYVTLGRGNMVCKGAVITCDILLGDFNLLNWNVTVGHDTSIGSFCVLNPSTNVSGNVHIGDGCFLGTGCQVLEGLTVGAGVVIGAGAVVTRSIHVPGTYVGVPARKVK